jgi:multiple sugar transport system substrate-binding protein
MQSISKRSPLMANKLPAVILIFFSVILSGCEIKERIDYSTPETEPTLVKTQEVKAAPLLTEEKKTAIPSTPTVMDLGSLSGKRIVFWHYLEGEAALTLEELAGKFNQENPFRIEVLIESKGSDLYHAVQQGINSGDYPNIVLAPSHYLFAWQRIRNILLNLNDFINDPDNGLSGEVIDDFQPLLWEHDDRSGTRRGISSFSNSSILAYNRSWAEELGFQSYPNTPTNFTNQVCAAAAETISVEIVDGRGGFASHLNPSGVMSWVLAYDGDVIPEPGNEYTFNSSEVRSAFEYIKSIFDAGCAWKPGVPYAENEFAAREALIYSTSILDLPYIEDAYRTLENADEWTVIPYPTVDGTGLINLDVYSYGIMEIDPLDELASWLFIKFMIAPENVAAIVKATSTYPGRISAMMYLDEYAEAHSPWAAAQELFSLGLYTPAAGSWESGRWAVREAAIELISPDFDRDAIPYLLNKLDILLKEIRMQNP